MGNRRTKPRVPVEGIAKDLASVVVGDVDVPVRWVVGDAARLRSHTHAWRGEEATEPCLQIQRCLEDIVSGEYEFAACVGRVPVLADLGVGEKQVAARRMVSEARCVRTAHRAGGPEVGVVDQLQAVGHDVAVED